MKRTTSWLIFVLVLFLAACGGNAAGGGTGIKGEVFLAECQGDQVGVDCFSQEPYQALLIVYDASYEEVARFETEVDGSFEYDLEAGIYIVHPNSDALYPIASNYRVVVAEGERTEMTIVYDSGIR